MAKVGPDDRIRITRPLTAAEPSYGDEAVPVRVVDLHRDLEDLKELFVELSSDMDGWTEQVLTALDSKTPRTVILAPNHGKTVRSIPVAQSAAGATVLAEAWAGYSHRFVGALLLTDTDGTLQFSGASSVLTGAMPFKASSGFIKDSNPSCPLWWTIAGEAMSLITTGGAARGVVLIVTEQP